MKLRPRFAIISILLAVAMFAASQAYSKQIINSDIGTCLFADIRPQALQQIGRPFDFTVKYFDIWYTGNSGHYVDQAVLFHGAYESELLQFLERVIPKIYGLNQATVLDIGAHHGTHAIFFARFAKAVHAFEPVMHSFHYLKKNIEINKFSNIFAHQLGLGEENIELPMYDTNDKGSPVASFVKDFWQDTKPIGKMQIVEGDSFFAEQGLESVDFVKVDVEGFEKPVLAGMKKTLSSHRPIAYVEVALQIGKSGFSSLNELLQHFPENYLALELTPQGLISNSLTPVEVFPKHKQRIELLLVPREKSELLTKSQLKNK